MQPNLAARHDLFSRHQTRMNRASATPVGLPTGTGFDSMRTNFRGYIPVGLTVGFLVVLEMTLVIVGARVGGAANPPVIPGSNTSALGRLIYVDYVYPFEIAAVVLLVAIIAAIALTHRKRKESKHQNPAAQVKVRREDRVRLVNMPSETRE